MATRILSNSFIKPFQGRAVSVTTNGAGASPGTTEKIGATMLNFQVTPGQAASVVATVMTLGFGFIWTEMKDRDAKLEAVVGALQTDVRTQGKELGAEIREIDKKMTETLSRLPPKKN